LVDQWQIIDVQLTTQLLASMPEAITPLLPNTIAPTSFISLMSEILPPVDVANLWKGAMDADQLRAWPCPRTRICVLVGILRSFEHCRTRDYSSLRTALANKTTQSGRPLNILGTRCEIFTRAAEGLFSEGRREPGARVGILMLVIAEQLLNSNLKDCRQRDDPRFAKRWLGIRGVSRLLLALHATPEPSADGLRASVDDLEAAFKLGNRGASAATYLLDALLHLLEIEPTPGSLARIDAAVAMLTKDETQNRGVLHQLGRYSFLRSFHTTDPSPQLHIALDHLTNALKYPHVLSFEEAFVRLNRGQVLVRIAISLERLDEEAALARLNDGISDLKYAVESAPDKYGKQRALPSALSTRADYYSRNKRYEEAESDLQYLLQHHQLRHADPIISRQAGLRLLLIAVRRALDADNLQGLPEFLRLILDHPDVSTIGIVLTAVATKELFKEATEADDPDLLKRAIQALQSVALEHRRDPSSIRTHFSHLGGLLFKLGRVWDDTALEGAVAAYHKSINATNEPPPIELLSLHGDAMLQLAKYRLRSGASNSELIELFEAAAEGLAQAAAGGKKTDAEINASFRREVTYSKAGEAYHRLFSISGLESDARAAIEHFEEAMLLGNESHELLGLLGDAYYRLYRLTRQQELIDRAIDYKTRARSKGGRNRENLSLSAKLAIVLWERTGNAEHLTSAIRLVAEAHEVAPTWPWPPFQLLEILETLNPSMVADVVARASEVGSFALLKTAGDKADDALISLGCQLVIRDDEFAKKTLGGRQPVYVLDDPHRLLGDSYVFKHTDHQSALRDRETIASFSKYLRERQLAGLRLPRPLAVVPRQGSSVVYVMRRARGIQLGRLILRAQTSGEPAIRSVERALTYLAAYHAWGQAIRGETLGSLEHFVRMYLKDEFQIPPSSIPSTTHTLLKNLGALPETLKKDAHPENWLIDDRGNLSMIDFESSKPLPVLFEVAQLLDDYPLLPVDLAGWQLRRAMCRQYLTAKNGVSATRIDDETVDAVYGIFVSLRCAVGLRSTSRKSKVASSGSLRARAARAQHYRELLSWLSIHHSKPGVQEFARLLPAHNKSEDFDVLPTKAPGRGRDAR
jgi:tetratricopeptide (TPR) repeat protein